MSSPYPQQPPANQQPTSEWQYPSGPQSGAYPVQPYQAPPQPYVQQQPYVQPPPYVQQSPYPQPSPYGYPPPQQFTQVNVVGMQGRVVTNHVLHLILTIFSCGWWGIVWLIVWAVNSNRNQQRGQGF
ncbi:hypothetical protein [Umezawaea beigongshangensis]|uniref:hypothetical protein n=1 Tax=Umezawaea beigongshangensis TaxID=2780383 RepID=UPI0018F1BCED|nr:hypothetical protein [Umezawaea beigongshangensis]